MSIERTVHDKLIAAGKTLSLAESCTGGRMASRLTKLPGSSRYFLGSLVVYSNQLKTDLLKVPAHLIEKHGAVSPEVVESLVRNLISLTHSDFGIAITGIAGPDGGTPEKPVGLVHFALISRNGNPIIWSHQFHGSRTEIIDSTVTHVLTRLEKLIDREKLAGEFQEASQDPERNSELEDWDTTLGDGQDETNAY